MSMGYKMNLSGKECYCQVFSEGRTNKGLTFAPGPRFPATRPQQTCEQQASSPTCMDPFYVPPSLFQGELGLFPLPG